jgi:hypothetical protein
MSTVLEELRAWLDKPEHRNLQASELMAKLDELEAAHAEKAHAERVAEAKRVFEWLGMQANAETYAANAEAYADWAEQEARDEH